ncbi:MAG: hypothetical protein KME40_32065 [Komarekiella atlantica HA4396-MV6]|jgi:hypothetical protein|nr:hypothetical protein [Komarekiella atlantica HA4396-MV6]
MEEKQVHWTELYGNKFRFLPHPLMLTPEGYELRISTKIAGESKNVSVPVVVRFDENYVIQFIANILSRLQPSKYNDWQKIVSKAYAVWNEKKGKE